MRLTLSIDVDWTSSGKKFYYRIEDDIEGGYREENPAYSLDVAFDKGRKELETVIGFISKITEQNLKV